MTTHIETQPDEADARLEALLIEGLTTGEDIPLSPEFWSELKQDAARLVFVFGDKEEAAGAVSVRTRAKGDQGSVPLAEFIAKAKAPVASQSTEL
jgi:hypothetical protein